MTLPRKQKAALITSAAPSRAEELAHRKRQYMVTMSMRVVAFVGAIILPVPIWAKLVLMGAATILPWVAVQRASIPSVPAGGFSPTAIESPGRRALGDAGPVVEGEAVRGEAVEGDVLPRVQPPGE